VKQQRLVVAGEGNKGGGGGGWESPIFTELFTTVYFHQTVEAKTIFSSLNSQNYIEFRDNIKVMATF
jgi:hypothetical protein